MIFLLAILLINIAGVSAAISCRGYVVEKKDAKTDFTIPIDYVNKQTVFTKGWKDFFTKTKDECNLSACILMDKTCMLPYKGDRLSIAV